jgi:hypothetical protein
VPNLLQKYLDKGSPFNVSYQNFWKKKTCQWFSKFSFCYFTFCNRVASRVTVTYLKMLLLLLWCLSVFFFYVLNGMLCYKHIVFTLEKALSLLFYYCLLLSELFSYTSPDNTTGKLFSRVKTICL